MKKQIYIVALAVLCLAGCQKPPQAQPAPIQLDMAQMIEKAQDTPRQVSFSVAEENDDSLYALLGAPQTFEAKLTPNTDKLSVTVNAVVELPKTAAMPVVHVKPAQFTQQQATAFFDALRDGAVMYDTDRNGLSRADMDETIRMWQGRATGRSSYSQERAAGQESDPLATPVPQNEVYPDQTNAKAMWEYLEAERALMPEEIEATRSSALLREMIFSFGKPDLGRYMGVRAVENPLSIFERGKEFSIRNDMDVMDWSDEKIDWGEEIGAVMEYSNPSADNRDSRGYDGWINTRITDEAAIPKQAQGRLNITPKQARDKVEAIIAKAGSDLVINAVYLLEEKPAADENGKRSLTYDYSYTITCGRVINGVPCRTVAEAEANNRKSLSSEVPSWFYERIEFAVTDNGIRSFSWMAPMEVTEVVTENAALLPFADIADVASRMLLVVHESDTNDPDLLQKGVTIDRVALELQRITENDATDRGTVIPVWNFYGSVEYEFSFDLDRNNNGLPKSLLTINAIDGSVIDAWQGF